MRRPRPVTVVLLAAASLIAWTPAAAQGEGDFDYLLGDWAFTSVSQEWGAGRGYWSAARLAEPGQVLDEYRVVGGDGETLYLTTTLRVYDRASGMWVLASLEGSSGLQNLGTARRAGAEMHLEQRFGPPGPGQAVWRIRYYDIGPDRFSWTGDRSTDGGATWAVGHLTIEARRIGPPRTVRLTPGAEAGGR